MGKSWLVCVLMGALIGTIAWGQAQPGAPAQAPSAGHAPPMQQVPGHQTPAMAAPAESKPPAEVPMSGVRADDQGRVSGDDDDCVEDCSCRQGSGYSGREEAGGLQD